MGPSLGFSFVDTYSPSCMLSGASDGMHGAIGIVFSALAVCGELSIAFDVSCNCGTRRDTVLLLLLVIDGLDLYLVFWVIIQCSMSLLSHGRPISHPQGVRTVKQCWIMGKPHTCATACLVGRDTQAWKKNFRLTGVCLFRSDRWEQWQLHNVTCNEFMITESDWEEGRPHSPRVGQESKTSPKRQKRKEKKIEGEYAHNKK
jgi:hypothetical protein